MDYSVLKKRYVGLDIFRCVSALMICMFHTTIHLGANYGILQEFFSMGAVFMTAFFILSGYSLFVNYANNNLMELKNIKTFWLKRIIGIIPMYYISSLIYIIFEIIANPGKEIIIQEIMLAPIETLCIQSTYSSLFSFSHNGGTWFISCIMICYLIYPLIQETLKQISTKNKCIITFVIVFVLLFSPILVWKMQIADIYSNPFFRGLEFTLGIILASMKSELDKNRIIAKYVYNKLFIVAVSILMIIGVSVATYLKIAVGNYMLYSWICLPCFVFIIIGLTGIEFSKQFVGGGINKIFVRNHIYIFFGSIIF